MHKDIETLIHALHSELNGVRIAAGNLEKKSFLKEHYAIQLDNQLFSVWQTHNGQWWWSDPQQTTENRWFSPNNVEKVVN